MGRRRKSEKARERGGVGSRATSLTPWRPPPPFGVKILGKCRYGDTERENVLESVQGGQSVFSAVPTAFTNGKLFHLKNKNLGAVQRDQVGGQLRWQRAPRGQPHNVPSSRRVAGAQHRPSRKNQ